MKLEVPHTLKQIAEILGCAFRGDENQLVTGINEIHMVEEGDLVFVDHPKYYEKALHSAATTIIIDLETEETEIIYKLEKSKLNKIKFISIGNIIIHFYDIYSH